MPSPCQHLLMLTLALEDSLRRESWNEADSILVQRARVLDRLSPGDLSEADGPLLERCREAEGRILAFLEESKAAVTGSLRSRLQGRRAAAAYTASGGGAVSLDRAG